MQNTTISIRADTETKLDSAAERALHKLRQIIIREGDADGIRLQPWYIEQLIAEESRSATAAEITLAAAQLITELRKHGDKSGQEKGDPRSHTESPTLISYLAPIVS